MAMSPADESISPEIVSLGPVEIVGQPSFDAKKPSQPIFPIHVSSYPHWTLKSRFRKGRIFWLKKATPPATLNW
jgi:hypothetical protein